uniref:Protein CLP1 homolog n=1 Tax=Hordeum vulgare subsp. vulgare TaxID=112509 RepID=F2DVP0_HORVV|nr:predicted protein [Hordeum vulgare subsp. vulgare]
MDETKGPSTINPSSTNSSTEVVEWNLKPEHELRIETDDGKDKSLKLTLKEGTAELFGCELLKGHTYEFPPSSKFAVFTWHGASITVSSHAKMVYVSEDTPMLSYVNTHDILDKLRFAAQAKGKEGFGPRLMIMGPSDSGKSTLARILLNYAVRSGWKPTFVDLDVGQNEITTPGSLSATPVEHPVNVSDMGSISLKAPIVYYFGHASPSPYTNIYKKMTERLAASLTKRMDALDIARHSGVVINTCGWVEGQGYELLIHAAAAFKVNVMLVIGQDRLCNQLKSDPRIAKMVSVIKLGKSGGVVERDADYRRKARSRRIREYFYGPSGELCPHQKVVQFKDVNIYKVGGGVAAPSHALPLGAKPLLDPDRAVKVEPSVELMNMLLAVSFSKDPNTVLDSNVAGFLHVSNVNMEKKTLTLLCPAPGPLPERSLVMGTIKWTD